MLSISLNRFTVFILTLVISSSGYAQESYDYEFEQLLYDCFIAEELSRGRGDRTQLYDRLEQIFIRHEILSGTSGEDYVKSVEHVRDSFLVIRENTQLREELAAIENLPMSVTCMEIIYSQVDIELVRRSRIKQVYYALFRVEKDGRIYPERIVEEIFTLLEARDFENDYFRSLHLVTMAGVFKESVDIQGAQNLSEYVVEREQKAQFEESIKGIIEENQLLFEFQPDGTILLTGKNRNKEEILQDDVETYIRELIYKSSMANKSYNVPGLGRQLAKRTLITLRGDQESENYSQVKSRIAACFEVIWRNDANHYYHKPWEELTVEQQEWLKKLIPLLIVEEAL